VSLGFDKKLIAGSKLASMHGTGGMYNGSRSNKQRKNLLPPLPS
jgi:hypothetical protein